MKVYFDLDGVIRDLAGHVFSDDPDSWDTPIKGMSFYDYVDKNPSTLVDSPKTKYCEVISKFSPHIVTCQPAHWRTYTLKWIAENIPTLSAVTFVKHPDEKFKMISKSDWIVEDYPNFKDYSRVILIDHKYNRAANAVIRIKDPVDLLRLLNRYIGKLA